MDRRRTRQPDRRVRDPDHRTPGRAGRSALRPGGASRKEQAASRGWHVTLTHPRPGEFAGTSWLEAAGDTTDLSAFDALVCAEAQQLGPATLDLIKAWLNDSTATITPVLDLNRTDAVDRHDPPPWMREQVILRDRHCVFPWCGRDARLTDLDHTVPYVPPDVGGPPGQTNPHNLAPLCRRHHRAKTLTGWTYQRARDGTFTWTSPHARTFTVGPDGTYASPTADTHADRAETYTLAT